MADKKFTLDKPNELLTLSGLKWLRQRFGLSVAVIVLALASVTIIWWNRSDIEQRPGVGPIVEIISRKAIPIVQPGRVTIAVAHFEHDKDLEHESLLLDEIRRFEDAELIRIDRIIIWPGANTERMAEAAANRDAKQLLHLTGADVLIWGRILTLKDRSILRVYWTTAEDMQGTKRTERYTIENLLLPAQFWDDLREIMRTLVKLRTSSIADTIRDNTLKLMQKSPPQGSSEDIEQAIELYRDALAATSRETSPRERAAIQQNLGRAYQARIQGDSADNVETAIKLFRDALEVSSRDASPRDWAAIQENLANAYQARIKGDRADNIETAIQLFEDALAISSRDARPRELATIQENLANAYQARIEGDHADNLRQAMALYQRALAVTPQESAPRDWAALQENLANVYQARIDGDRADNLRQAVVLYQNALTVTTRQDFPQDWARTRSYLGAALQMLGELESGTVKLNEAIVNYREALGVLSREQAPLDWATTQSRLGSALLAMGEREGGTARLEEATVAYREALMVLTRERAPLDWATTQNQLGNVLYLLGVRENKTALMQEAVAAWNASLTVAETNWPPGWVQYLRSRISATLDEITHQTKRQ
jgi:tetratricopeptide (TPR) repeat protein